MFPILFEDNYVLAIDKPAGLQVERDRFGNPSLETEVAGYFEKTYPWKKQLITGIVHRLDRYVGGVIVFAKTPMALKALNSQFEKREVRKIYQTLVEGHLPAPSGELVHWLRKDTENRCAVVSKKGANGAQESRLRYQVLEQKEKNSLVEIELLTGRYHQIRAQLSAVGCPIVGDEKYGAVPKMTNSLNVEITKERNLTPSQISLHACRLEFSHPKTGEAMVVESPFPFDF